MPSYLPREVFGLTSTHNRSNRDTMLAGSAVTLFHLFGEMLTKRCTSTCTRCDDAWGATMRTMIDIVGHALELRLPSANEAVRWLRTVRRRNVAAPLILASMAGPLATERVSAASPGDNEIRIGNTMPYT